jgi:hypothetical protein
MHARRYLELKQGETQFQLRRLTEDEFRQLRSTSLPIKNDEMFLLNLMLSERHNPERLSLPKALVTLEYFFGKASNWLDKWKSSFSFPLLLVLKKQVGRFFYLLRIEDYRGELEFRFYRILENGTEGYNDNICREPFEIEFSRSEINQFICYLIGYLASAAESFCKLLPVQPFLRHIDASHIIYGYRNGAFFEEQIDSPEQYEATIQAFETVYGSVKQEQQALEMRSLIQMITGESF